MRLLAFLLFVAGLGGSPGVLAQALPPAVETKGLVLLQPEDEIAERLGNDAEALARYAMALMQATAEGVGREPRGAGASGVLVVAVRPERRSKVWFEFGSNAVPVDLLTRLRARLETIEPPPVSSGAVSFSIGLELWGGGVPVTSAEQPVAVPAEWLDASDRLGGAAHTEQILDAVWPAQD